MSNSTPAMLIVHTNATLCCCSKSKAKRAKVSHASSSEGAAQHKAAPLKASPASSHVKSGMHHLQYSWTAYEAASLIPVCYRTDYAVNEFYLFLCSSHACQTSSTIETICLSVLDSVKSHVKAGSHHCQCDCSSSSTSQSVTLHCHCHPLCSCHVLVCYGTCHLFCQ